MKLLKVKLVGYKGIFNGMGMTNIEIDLSNSQNKVIMIKGDNGSGKSTLFNALHMFPDSNTQLMDMDCSKFLLYENGNYQYNIKIYHPFKNNTRAGTKAYISRSINGGPFQELNPNGNTRSYSDIIEEEFMLDKNYLSLSQLGVENRGLVDMIPSERKKFISSIMKDVDVFNQMHDIISKKASIYRSKISSITDKLKRLDATGNLEDKMSELNNKYDDINKDIEDTMVRIGVNTNKVKELDDDGTIISRIDEVFDNLNKVRLNFDALNSDITSAKKMLDIGYEIDADIIESVLIKVKSDKESLEKQLSDNTLYIKELMLEKDKINSEIQDKQMYMASLQTDENYDEYLKELKNVRAKLSELNPIIKEMKVNNLKGITTSDYDRIIEYMDNIKELNRTFKSEFYDSQLTKVFEKILDGSIKSYEYYCNEINRIHDDIENLNISLSKLERNKEQLEELDKRPSHCKIDNCYFLENVIKVPIKDKNKLEEVIQNTLDSIDNNRKLLEWYNIVIDILRFYEKYSGLIIDSKSLMSKLDIRSFKSDKDIIDSLLYNYDFHEYDEIQSLRDVTNVIDEYNSLLIMNEKYSIYEENYKKLMSVFDDINKTIDKLDVDAKEIYIKLEKYKSEKDELEKNISAHLNLQSILENLNNLYIKHKQMSIELNNINDEYKSLVNSNQSLSKINSDILKDKSRLSGLKDIKAKYNETMQNLQYSLRLSKEYKDDLKDLKDVYSKIEITKKACAPSTGIQTIFMRMYMNKILEVANNLLSYLFNGEFRLEEFVINAKEFKIPCRGNGILNEDISSMSTSQKCMISLVLSFSLLCQTSIKYNILKLDEMDGGLDNTNRIIFVDTLYRLINLLESEQVFIISHNNEMNLSECDLIILRSVDTYHSGNILYNYNIR